MVLFDKKDGEKGYEIVREGKEDVIRTKAIPKA